MLTDVVEVVVLLPGQLFFLKVLSLAVWGLILLQCVEFVTEVWVDIWVDLWRSERLQIIHHLCVGLVWCRHHIIQVFILKLILCKFHRQISIQILIVELWLTRSGRCLRQAHRLGGHICGSPQKTLLDTWVLLRRWSLALFGTHPRAGFRAESCYLFFGFGTIWLLELLEWGLI